MSDRPDRAATRRRRVTATQNISRMCLVCGAANVAGLQGRFYELEPDDADPDGGPELLGVFIPLPEHQSYPGRLHGGISSAILDETIGRAVAIGSPDVWGVTIEFSLRYRQPVPLDGEIRAVARITRDTSRIFEGTGEILLADGTVAVEAKGRYFKQPLEVIATEMDPADWVPDPREAPDEVELPGRRSRARRGRVS